MVAFELAVQDPAGIAIAARVGVDRIELCSALALGGLTPGVGLIEAAVDAATPVHVLVRPRAGDFAYDSAEQAVALRDVADAVDRGAEGVVIGATRAGRVDEDFLARAVDAAEGLEVTFHRAFDGLDDPGAGLDVLRAFGVTRVLTSGGAASALDALDALRRLVDRAGGGIQIMAGGGVRIEGVPAVLATGVAAVHASAKRITRVSGVALGSGDDGSWESTDEALAARFRAAVPAGVSV